MKAVSKVLPVFFIVAFLFACTDQDDSQIRVDGSTRATPPANPPPTTEIEDLGMAIFFDPSLSAPAAGAAFVDPDLSAHMGQACADCHDPVSGFADPVTFLPTSEGVIHGRFGYRNAPALAYSCYSPPMSYVFNETSGEWEHVGGQYWDGRAHDLAGQAGGPMMNPLEMANASRMEIIEKARQSEYAEAFDRVFGEGALDDGDSVQIFSRICLAVAAFECSPLVNRFSSKYDYFLAGRDNLSEAETAGLALFNTHCASCHPSTLSVEGLAPVFTEHKYHNMGVPQNPDNPYYTIDPALNPDGYNFIDRGLGAPIAKDDPDLDGMFKTPSLRNAAVSAPYTHNGYFYTLRGVVSYWNSREVVGAPWPPPEVAANLEAAPVGSMGLTDDEIEAIVMFLHALTDGYNRPLGRDLSGYSQ